jgi:hypothetical protein
LLAFGIILWAALASGCATMTYADRPGDNRVSDAVAQPFRDFSVMREDPPEVLKRAVTAPYDLQADAACASLMSEIAALNRVLGPDLDVSDPKTLSAGGGMASGLIRSTFGVPFRGVVRKLTGAERREEALKAAILAGVARRAFLKGVARANSCQAPPVL